MSSLLCLLAYLFVSRGNKLILRQVILFLNKKIKRYRRTDPSDLIEKSALMKRDVFYSTCHRV